MSSNRNDPVTVGAAGPENVLTPGEHGVMIDGLEQRYHVAGQGPVCLAHSGGPGVSWDYLRMPEVEHHLTLVYLEPIGTGNSGRLADPRGYTLDRYVRHIDGLMTHLGLDKAYLLGHSHGGFVAQRYALQHPERLSGLILYDTSPTTTEEFSTDMGAQLARAAERHADAPWVADTMSAWQEIFAVSADPATSDEQLTQIFRRMAPVYFADYPRIRDQLAPMLDGMCIHGAPNHGEEPAPFDVRDQLSSITVPTLVIVGRYDPVCSVRWSMVLHEGIAGSELALFEQSGHFAHIEEPEAFADAIRRWLMAVSRGTP